VLPEKVPAGGLIILRDGDSGEPEQTLGGFGNAYYQHAVEIDFYVEEVRLPHTMSRSIPAAADRRCARGRCDSGGLAFGLTCRCPIRFT
jgi:hypothetical protein